MPTRSKYEINKFLQLECQFEDVEISNKRRLQLFKKISAFLCDFSSKRPTDDLIDSLAKTTENVRKNVHLNEGREAAQYLLTNLLDIVKEQDPPILNEKFQNNFGWRVKKLGLG